MKGVSNTIIPEPLGVLSAHAQRIAMHASHSNNNPYDVVILTLGDDFDRPAKSWREPHCDCQRPFSIESNKTGKSNLTA